MEGQPREEEEDADNSDNGEAAEDEG